MARLPKGAGSITLRGAAAHEFFAGLVEKPKPDGVWVILYADQDRLPEHFSGAGADEAAKRRFDQLKASWTCRLFRCVAETGYGPALTVNPQL